MGINSEQFGHSFFPLCPFFSAEALLSSLYIGDFEFDLLASSFEDLSLSLFFILSNDLAEFPESLYLEESLPRF